MKHIQIDRHDKYAWVWKFLITWGFDFSISFYPDYETPNWEVWILSGSGRKRWGDLW